MTNAMTLWGNSATSWTMLTECVQTNKKTKKINYNYNFNLIDSPPFSSCNSFYYSQQRES